MILAAMHGSAPATARDAEPREATADEAAVAALLQHIWFSCLIGWAGGLMNQNEVIERMRTAAALLTRAPQSA